MDKRHGGPWDRGSADYYYGHRPRPHYYVAGTLTSPRVEREQMTPEQVREYLAGYADAEAFGDRKQWD